jgi:ArsR family transcriptional regulator, zinc-responsive transcriptional repressor
LRIHADTCINICVDTHSLEELGEEQVLEAVSVLKLLADPTRLRIVEALLHGEHSVNELAEHVDAKPAAVSQHLAKLRWGRLVQTRKDGNRVFYRASDVHVARLVAEALGHAAHVRPAAASSRREPRGA